MMMKVDTWMMDEFDKELGSFNVTVFQYTQEISKIDGWMDDTKWWWKQTMDENFKQYYVLCAAEVKHSEYFWQS